MTQVLHHDQQMLIDFIPENMVEVVGAASYVAEIVELKSNMRELCSNSEMVG